ncbi:MAG: fibronectin type III domain-containing protein [Planctomycetia bacterium]|nr:fibronectin type III domain-containing protein [Planctomycetia bacterium]
MIYYYIATEAETDRFFFDPNKWSETPGGTTPTLGIPSTSDDFVIGESAEDYVGTPESFVTFSFCNSSGVYLGLPNAVTIYGYVRYSNMPIIRSCNISVKHGTFYWNARVYANEAIHIKVDPFCGLSFLGDSYLRFSDNNNYNCIEYDETSEVILNVRLEENETTYQLPYWPIDRLYTVFVREGKTLRIETHVDQTINTLYIGYTDNVVSSGSLIFENTLQITGSTLNLVGRTSRFELSGNVDLKFIGSNNQWIQFTTITSSAGVITLNLAKPSGTVTLSGVNVKMKGYCGTDAAGNLIAGQNPADAKVTVYSTSDVTFNGTTNLAYLTNNGTIGKQSSDIYTKIYNYSGTGSVDTTTRFRPNFSYYFLASDNNVLSNFYDPNNWTMIANSSTAATLAPVIGKVDDFQLGYSSENFVGTAENPLAMTVSNSILGTNYAIGRSLTLFGYFFWDRNALFENIFVNYGSLTGNKILSLWGINKIKIADNCSVIFQSAWVYYPNNPEITIAETGTLNITGTLTVNNNARTTEDTIILNFTSCGTLKVYPARISNHISLNFNSDAIIGDIHLNLDDNQQTLSSFKINTINPLNLTGNLYATNTGNLNLEGNIELNAIGDNDQNLSLNGTEFSENTELQTNRLLVNLDKTTGNITFENIKCVISGTAPGYELISADVTFLNQVAFSEDFTCENCRISSNLELYATGENDQTISFVNTETDGLTVNLDKTTGNVVFAGVTGNTYGEAFYLELNSSNVTAIAPLALDSLVVDSDSILIINNELEISEASIEGELTISQSGTVILEELALSENGKITGTGSIFLDWNIDTTNILGSIAATVHKVASNVPSPPILELVSKTNHETDVTWNSIANATEYLLEVSTDQEIWTDTDQYIQNQTSKNFDDLDSDTRYYYRVQARNLTGNTSFSNVLYCKTIKDAPTGLQAETRTHSTLLIEWPPVAEAQNYVLDISKNSDFTESQTQIVPADQQSYLFTSLDENTTYYLKMAVRDLENDLSIYSNTVSPTTYAEAISNVEAPDNVLFNQTFQLDATESIGNSIDIDWGDGTYSYSQDTADNWLFSHSFDKQGVYEICILISEPGNYYSVSRTLYINVLADSIIWSYVGAGVDEYKIKMTREKFCHRGDNSIVFTANIITQATQTTIDPSCVNSVSYTLYRKGFLDGQRKEIIPGHHLIWRGPADSVLSNCQTDSSWTLDSVGYNFRCSPDGHDIPMFFSPGIYDVEFIIQMQTGNPVVLNFCCIVE